MRARGRLGRGASAICQRVHGFDRNEGTNHREVVDPKMKAFSGGRRGVYRLNVTLGG